MKPIRLTLAGALLFNLGSACAGSIGLSFTSNRDTGAILDPGDSAGVVAQTHWNSSDASVMNGDNSGSISGVLPGGGSLVDNSGEGTGATVTWSSSNTWTTDNGNGNGDRKLMNGYIDDTFPTAAVTFSDIPYEQYDVYVYFGSDGNGRTGTVTDGTTTYSYTTNSNLSGDFPGGYVRTTDTGAGHPSANYAVFSDRSGSSLTLTNFRGSGNTGIHGIQIVEKMILPGMPEVETLPADSLAATSATLNGNLIENGIGEDPATLVFYYGTTDGGAVTGAWSGTAPAATRTSPGPFFAELSGLTPKTTYFCRAFVSNSVGEDWAPGSVSFTTPAALPTVRNLAASEIFGTAATLGGSITSTGGESPNLVVYYGVSDGGTDAGAWDAQLPLGLQSGSATGGATGLAPSTTYYFRAAATNSAGTAWAPDSGSFMTPTVTLPTVVNSAATGVNGTFATLNGEITDAGGDPPEVTVFYGTADGGAVAGDWQFATSAGRHSGDFSRLVSNLQPTTTYYFRARAQNAAGETWAPSSLSFATPVFVAPTVVINEIHYDEQDKTERAEFIELHNPGSDPVDLSSYSFTGGIDYVFPASTLLPPGGYVVVAEDPATMAARFGYPGAHGPFANGTKLSNSGERIVLEDPGGNTIDEVDYKLGFPWPTVGDPAGTPLASPSIELINPLLDNDLGGSWRASGFPVSTGSGSTGKAPTPGAANRSFAISVPPQIRQVNHLPEAPVTAQEITVTATITDPDGVGAVSLRYQIVEPGDYFCRYLKFNNDGSPNMDPRYEDPAEWTSVPMVDDGTGGDALAADSVYTAVLPASLQTNRRLIRYRIRAVDLPGTSITVPYPDDPQPNFAYFVYDGTPAWSGSIRPGDGVVNYPGALMSSIPTYFLLSTNSWVDDSQFGGYGGEEYLWPGTMVYDGRIYDHIQYRPRGGSHRFDYGKNFWKFDFPRGHGFKARDRGGDRYDADWDKLNFSSIVQQVGFNHRGEQGLFEGVGFKMFELAGVEASKTHYVQFYVVDQADPIGENQYEGDYYGLFLAIEQMDGRFLDEHGLPDGNLYKIEGNSGSSNNQGPTQVSDGSDVSGFISTSNGNPAAEWWEEHLDIGKYLSYRAVVEGIHHYDIADGKNFFYYHNPETDKFEVHPWDLDLTWADNMYGSGNHPFKMKVAENPAFNLDYQNRVREIKDLLYNSDEGWRLIDDMVRDVWTAGSPSLVGADRRLWDNNPRLNTKDRYYDVAADKDFSGMIQILKNYIVSRGDWMTANLLTQESGIPATPVITYAGVSGFPSNDLRFTSSEYSSATGFGAMEWRISEIYNESTSNYVPGDPYLYEIEGAFESGELTSFDSGYRFPTLTARPGHVYRARVRHRDSTGRYSHWSAPVEFLVSQPDVTAYVEALRLTELHYHPADPSATEQGMGWLRDGDFEFVELKNVGPVAMDLSDLRFTKGIDFQFPAGTLIQPGAYVVVVKNRAAFEFRYGAGLPVVGEWDIDHQLSNGGENVRLSLGSGTAVIDFDYRDDPPWPTDPDGGGSSLTMIDPEQTLPTGHSDPLVWRPSRTAGGSPGSDDYHDFDDWAADNGLGVGASYYDDRDDDGIIELLEYALASDPNQASTGDLPVPGREMLTVGTATEPYLTITFKRPTEAMDLAYSVELAERPDAWRAGVAVLVSRTDHPDGTSTEVWRAEQPVSALLKQFMRLKVER